MFVGFDTSNYTTSVAVLDDSNKIVQQKKILQVKQGEKGLRQSDAVFQHTVNLPTLVDNIEFADIKGVGVSVRPRSIEGSYMPCFLVGKAVATSVAKTNNVNLYETSHQIGHVLAALYSCNKLELVKDKFIAFHLSGGTTEALLVEPDENEVIKATLVAKSNDLKAGQAIDRAGVMLGMKFPCGKELDDLAKLSDKQFNIKPSMDGLNCSLSGVENKAKRMFDNKEKSADIAKFVLTYIAKTVEAMLFNVIVEYGDMPILFSGGVSSNSLLRNTILSKFDAFFADPIFSCDNAAGLAVYAKLKHGRD